MFGLIYDNGEVVEKNLLGAVMLYEKACRGESIVPDAIGCWMLGFMYATGSGVTENTFKAKELFGKACDLQLAKGCKSYKLLNESEY